MAKVTTKRAGRKQATTMALGIDLGDRTSVVCGFDAATGEVLGPSRIATSPEGIEGLLGKLPRVRVVLETD